MSPPIQRTATPNASHGSVTLTQSESSVPFNLPSGTLRLRAASDSAPVTDTASSRRIQWAEDVIDNEGMGRKSSKVCCIYHRPREAGESSDEDSSSSSSDSDSDSEPDNSRAQPANRSSHRQQRRDHDHDHDHNQDQCEHHHGPSASTKEGKRPERKRSPNAYERLPKRKQPK